MPYEIKEQDNQYCVVKTGSDSPVDGGCHNTRADAVKHMRALYAAEPTGTMKYSVIAFNDDILTQAEDDDPNIQWLQAWRYSTWDHPRYGTVEISPNTGQRFKQHFENGSLGRQHLINYDHGSDAAKGGKAGGVILDIEPKDDGIYYKVKFTDTALEEIQKGEWHYLSPEYDDWVNPETGELFEDMPFDLALTNTPFFKGMPPLNFSEIYTEEAPKEFAVWSTAFVNNLPDSSFLYISPGGKKDGDGKTTPRSLRHFPYKDGSGKIDLPHLRNAVARIPQANISSSLKSSLQARARKLLSNAGGSPKGGTVDELLRQFAERLGMELSENATEEEILAQAEELNKTIEPLRKARKDGERNRTFREAFPEEYDRMKKLEQTSISNEALAFAESYARFTIKDGQENEYKSTLGFSQVVIEKIAEVHKKFSDKSATQTDLKSLLDLIGDKGIVDYAEHGSSRSFTDKPRSEDPKMAFAEVVQEVMDNDNLSYEQAMSVAKAKFPDLYEGYQRAIPQR